MDAASIGSASPAPPGKDMGMSMLKSAHDAETNAADMVRSVAQEGAENKPPPGTGKYVDVTA